MRSSHPASPNWSFLSHINIAVISHAVGESGGPEGCVDGGATTLCLLVLLSEKSEPQFDSCTTGFNIAVSPPVCSDVMSAPLITE